VNRRTFNSSMLGLLALPGVLESACAAPRGGTDEQQLVVIPLLNSQEVFLVPPARPHCFVRHLSLEGFACKNWQVVSDAVQGTWVPNHNWEWREDGTFACMGRAAAGVRYTLEMRPGTDLVDIRVTVKNLGTKTLQDLFGGMCVDIRRNVLMYGPTLERAFVSAKGALVPMGHRQVAGSAHGVMSVFFLNGTPAEKRWIPEAWAAYGWGMSTIEIDSAVAAVVSTDGGWTVGVWFWPCQMVTGNSRLPWYGCIHSNPSFGTLVPGKSASAVGRIYIAKGGLQEIWTRMEADLHKAQRNELSLPS